MLKSSIIKNTFKRIELGFLFFLPVRSIFDD